MFKVYDDSNFVINYQDNLEKLVTNFVSYYKNNINELLQKFYLGSIGNNVLESAMKYYKNKYFNTLNIK